MSGLRTDEKIARLRRLVREDRTLAEISAELGVSRISVWRWARDFGIVLRGQRAPVRETTKQKISAYWAKPENNGRLRVARKRAWMARVRTVPGFCGDWRRHRRLAPAVPNWVPHDLVEDFVDTAAFAGEEAAASHVRRLKHEGSRT